jgi:hypothetical protein
MLKEAVVAEFEGFLPGIWRKRLRKSHENVGQNNLGPGKDSNRVPPEHKCNHYRLSQLTFPNYVVTGLVKEMHWTLHIPVG